MICRETAGSFAKVIILFSDGFLVTLTLASQLVWLVRLNTLNHWVLLQ